MCRVVSFLLGAVLLICHGVPGAAQERPRIVPGRADQAAGREPVVQSDDVLKVRTRVVFLDALVKDRKTNEPVRDLAAADFQVNADGRPREISYFTREGDSRRPLRLLLFIDLWSMYGGARLKSPDTMRRLASALVKLAPEDEAGVMTTWVEEGDPSGEPAPKLRLVSDFTRERAETSAALASLPELISRQQKLLEGIAARRSTSSGDLRLDLIWRLSDIADEIIPMVARSPNSHFVVVGLLDDLFDLRKGEREDVAGRALRAGISFNGLVFQKSLGAKFFLGTFNKLFMTTRGLSVHAADYLAGQTGGEVVGVGDPADLAAGLESFISSLTARYNIGFTLGEHEQDDGRMHALRVKVRAKGSRRGKRDLLVRARRGYYLPRH